MIKKYIPHEIFKMSTGKTHYLTGIVIFSIAIFLTAGSALAITINQEWTSGNFHYKRVDGKIEVTRIHGSAKTQAEPKNLPPQTPPQMPPQTNVDNEQAQNSQPQQTPQETQPETQQTTPLPPQTNVDNEQAQNSQPQQTPQETQPETQQTTPPATQQALDISSVVPVSDINVAYGADIASANLPATITATMSDGTTQSIPLTWDGGTPAYDPNTAGTYVFAGTLTLPDNTTNTNNIKASANVIVAVQSANPSTDDVTQNSGASLLNSIVQYPIFKFSIGKFLALIFSPLKFIIKK